MKFENGVILNRYVLRNYGNVDYKAWREARLNDPMNHLFAVRCRQCASLIEYDLEGIDGKRRWYPNGFVYCTKCGIPNRHSAANLVLPENNAPASKPEIAEKPVSAGTVRFCSECGAGVGPNASFCAKCGHRLK